PSPLLPLILVCQGAGPGKGAAIDYRARWFNGGVTEGVSMAEGLLTEAEPEVRCASEVTEQEPLAEGSRGRLPRPETTTSPVRVRWQYAIGIPLVHLLAALAFVPWLFSWWGVGAALLGLYVFGTLGINLCYHRMLTHQGLVAPKWLEHSLAILGVCTMQDTPACWVAMHRIHHKHSDDRPDPHSPLVNFLWGHCGWLMFHNREFIDVNYYQRFTRDLLRDPFYMKLERNENWLKIYTASILVFFIAGFLIGWPTGGSAMAGVQ